MTPEELDLIKIKARARARAEADAPAAPAMEAPPSLLSQTGSALWDLVPSKETLGNLPGQVMDSVAGAVSDPAVTSQALFNPAAIPVAMAKNAFMAMPGADKAHLLGNVVGGGIGALGGPLAAATTPLGVAAGGAVSDWMTGNGTPQDQFQRTVQDLALAGAGEGLGKMFRGGGEPPPPTPPIDPSTEAALRYAGNAPAGSMLKRSPDDIMASGQLKPVEERAVDQAVRHSQDPNMLGAQFNYPESTASNMALANSQALARRAPDIYETGIFETGGRILPLSGKGGGVATFERGSYPARTAPEALFQIRTALDDLGESRRAVVGNIEQARNDYNKAFNSAESRIPGVTFSDNIAPQMAELSATVDRLSKLGGTSPMAEAMVSVVDDVKASIGKITRNVDPYQLASGTSTTVTSGEASLVDVLDLYENVNKLRRAYKEFDPATNAKMLAGTVSDLTGHGASLEALDAIHEALGGAIEDKASQVLQHAPKLPGEYPWKPLLSLYDGETVRRINSTYGALRRLEDPIEKYALTNTKMESSTPPGRMMGQLEALSGSKPSSIPVTTPGRALTQMVNQKAGNVVGGIMGRNQPPPGLLVAEQAEGLQSRPFDNLRQLSFLRANPIPILPRSFEAVKGDPVALRDVGVRLSMYGVVPAPEMFESMSEPQKRDAYNLLASIDPNISAAPHGFKTLVDNKFTGPMGPMESMSYSQMVKDNTTLSDTKRQEILTAASQGKFIPMEEAPKAPIQQADPAALSRMSGALSNVVPMPTRPSIAAPTDTDLMVEKMRESISRRDVVSSGQ